MKDPTMREVARQLVATWDGEMQEQLIAELRAELRERAEAHEEAVARAGIRLPGKRFARYVVKFMNQLVKVDREAIERLVATRTPCNQAMRLHPTVQVDWACEVGLLGILNGLAGARPNGWGWIIAVFDEPDGRLLRFEVASDEEAKR